MVIFFVARYFLLKSTSDRLEAQQKINKISHSEFHTESKLQEAESNFEAQYDPNNDFAIFGVGNERLGGIQDMQEKMNIADKAKSMDSSDSSE